MTSGNKMKNANANFEFEYFSKFGEHPIIFIKFGTKNNEFDSKIAKFPGFAIKNRKKFNNNLRIF